VPSFSFEIEFIDPNGRFILARQLGRGGFKVGPGARLGEVPVTGVTMPRAKAPDGTLRQDIFGFKVADPALATRVRVGQTVELRADSDGADVPP
jgi:hypothetical protein